MQLMRVLQSGLKLQTKDGREPEGDNICGSMAKHFAVSQNGELSFYQVADSDSPAPERVALGVMLAKVLAGRARIDDIEACLIDKDSIAATGASATRDGAGETLLADVNRAHWAIENVSIRRLADIVISALTPHVNEVFVSRSRLTLEFDRALETGQLSGITFDEKLLSDLAEIRKTKAYRRALKPMQSSAI